MWKPIIIKNPNEIVKKCRCGKEYTLSLTKREHRCSCGLVTLYVPHTPRGYFAIAGDDTSSVQGAVQNGQSNQPETVAGALPTAQAA